MTSNQHRTIAVLAASLSLVWVAVPAAQVDSENVSPPLPDWLETWLLFEGVGGNSVEFGTLDVPPIPHPQVRSGAKFSWAPLTTLPIL